MDWLSHVISLCAASLVYLLLQRWLQRKRAPPGTRLPPGPPGLPFVGHLQFAAKDFHCNQAIKWAKQYGPVYRIKTGSTDVVIINDFRRIRKYLAKKELMARPRNWLFNEGDACSISTLSGEPWAENRRFCMQVLGDVGYGKAPMVEQIKEECRGFVEQISKTSGAPILINTRLVSTVSSNIATFVYGTRHAYGNPHRLHMEKMLMEVLEAIGTGSVVAFLPLFVRKLLRKIPSTRRNAIASRVKKFVQYTQTQVEQHKKSMDDNHNRDLIDGYLKKIQEHENDPTSYFKPRTLVFNVLTLFIGGSGTVAVTLQWHFLNFADKPHTVQARVQKEIDDAVGTERQPTWEDRHRMPYTMACIWEMNRWKIVSPLGMPRGVLEDTLFDEFYIPSGTTVVPNLWAVHHDPRMWKEPSKFDPSRFLREDGSLAHPKPDYFIPFSFGKRMCPGEVIAHVEIFLYITCVLQKYRILPEGEEVNKINSVNICIEELDHCKLKFIPR